MIEETDAVTFVNPVASPTKVAAVTVPLEDKLVAVTAPTYKDVNWPTDVILGWAFAVTVLAVLVWLEVTA